MRGQSISFIKPMINCEVYLIILNDIVIGSIIMDQDIISNIDINGSYFEIIQDELIPKFLFEQGLDRIDIVCDTVFFDYYKDFGFYKCYNTDNDRIILRYETRCTCRDGEKMELVLKSNIRC